MKKAILLVNLGSPDSPSVKDVGRYLAQFLMDKHVIDLPLVLRFALVHGIILRTRPKKSAKAYKKIWTKEGSPLIQISRNVAQSLAKRIGRKVYLAMRYGNPSIKNILQEILTENSDLEVIHLIPLYPHYAMASFETVVLETQKQLKKIKPNVPLIVEPPFYKNKLYIKALAETLEKDISSYDHVLFSYHGVPLRHLRKSDTQSHCTKVKDCCKVFSLAHQTCYRHQVMVTTKEVAKLCNIPKEKYSLAYQSRLKGDQWLTPYTDEVLANLPAQNKKKVLLICPSFVSDCLETLEEISMQGREIFMQNGGVEFESIACLNAHTRFIDLLESFAQK